MTKHSRCPHCNNVSSGSSLFRCPKCGTVFCNVCALGIINNYCPNHSDKHISGKSLGSIK